VDRRYISGIFWGPQPDETFQNILFQAKFVPGCHPDIGGTAEKMCNPDPLPKYEELWAIWDGEASCQR
jgi:hypothetical protein